MTFKASPFDSYLRNFQGFGPPLKRGFAAQGWSSRGGTKVEEGGTIFSVSPMR